ncbi:MAG: hypothetical protein FWD49_04530 [Firmicutes bacterium]|nr:hypothetical protein [Bacillota bacterium]
MSCEVSKKHIKCNCTCPCPRRGRCCECLAYHVGRGNFPACFFSTEAEAKHNRSLETLLQDRNIITVKKDT